MRRINQLESESLVILFTFATLCTALFDILRKTVFQGDSWNYQYPRWEFIYDPVFLSFLIFVSILLVLTSKILLELEGRQFLTMVVIFTVALSALSLLATPVKSYKWAFQPHVRGPIETFQYYPATIAADEGIRTFFATFHSAPTLNGGDRLETTQYLTRQLQHAEYLPWNDILADYASGIVTQRHGPIPALLVAPFLFILGSSPTNAVIGSYAITITLPVLSYFIFKPYFTERRTRLGTLLVMTAPAYLIYQRYGTVSYDAITGVVVALAVLLFLKACRTDKWLFLVTSGIVFSGAMLSKISILTLFPAFAIILAIYSNNVRETIVSGCVFVSSTLLLPISLLPLGYNFVVQYLYDIARIQMSNGGSSGLFARLISFYNLRLLGVAVLCFVLVFTAVNTNKGTLLANEERDLVAIAFLPAILPFLLLKGITLSRHLLPLLPVVVFVGLCGIERGLGRRLRYGETIGILGSTLILTLINI